MDGTGNSSWVPWPTFSDEPPPIGDLDDDEDDYGGFTSASDTVINNVSPHPVSNQPPLPPTVSTGKEVMGHVNIEDLSKEIDALSKEFSSDGQVLSFPEDIPSPDSTTVEAYPNFPNVTSPRGLQEPSNLSSNNIEDDFGDFATPEPPSQIASHPSPDSTLEINPLGSQLSSSSELRQTQKTTNMEMMTSLSTEGMADTSSKGREDSFFSDLSKDSPVTVPTGNEDDGWGDFSSSDPSSSVPPPSGEQVTTVSSQWEANFGQFEEFRSSAEVESNFPLNFPAQTHGPENDDFGDFSGPVSLDTTTTKDSGGVSIPADEKDVQTQNTSDDTFEDFNSATLLTEDTQQQQKTTDTFGQFSSGSSAHVQDDDDFGDFTSSVVKQKDDVSDSFGGFSSATVGGSSTTPPTSVAAIPPATSSAISPNLQDFKTLLQKHYPEPERSSSDVKPDSYWSISLHSQVSSQNSLWLTAQASSSVRGVLFQWENSETQDNFFVSTHVDPAMAPATVSRQIKSALQLGDFTSILQDPSSPTSPTSSQSSIANVLLDLSFQPTLASPAPEEIVFDKDLLGLDFSLSVQPPQPSLSSNSANTEVQSTAETQSDDFGDFSTAPVTSLAETTSDRQPSNIGEGSTLTSISTTFPTPNSHQEGEDDFGDFSSAAQPRQTDNTLHTNKQTTGSLVANLVPLQGTDKGEMMRENLYSDFSSAVDVETVSSVKEKEVTFDANFPQSLNSQLQPVRDDSFGDFSSAGTSERSSIFSAPIVDKPMLPTMKASSDLLATSFPHSFSSTDTNPLPETSTFPSTHTEAPKDFFGLSSLTSKVTTSELKVSKDDDFFGDFSSAEIPQRIVTPTATSNATESKTTTNLFGNVQSSTGIPTTSGVDRTVHVSGDFFTEAKQPPSLIPVNVHSNLSTAAAGTPLMPVLSPQTQVMTETTGNSGWTMMKSNGMTMTGSAHVTMSGSSTVNETGSGRVTMTGSSTVNETGSGRVTMTGSSGPSDQTWASDEGWTSSLSSQLIGTNFSDPTKQQSGVLSSTAVGDDDFGDFAGAPLKQSLVTNPPSIQVIPISSYNQLTNVTSQVANPTPNFPAFGMGVGMSEAHLSVSNHPQSSGVAGPYEAFSDFTSFRSSQLSSDRITMSSPTRLSPEAQRLLDRIPDVRFMLSDVRLPAQSSI